MGIKFIKDANLWPLITGIIMIGLGILVWMHPAGTLVAIALYLGIALVVVGIGYIISSFSYDSGWRLFVGVLDLFVGIIFITNLGVTAASLSVIFALWILAVGAIQLVSAFQVRQIPKLWVWPLLWGIVGIAFAFLILAFPNIGAVTISMLMGLYIIMYGAIEVMEYIYSRRKRKLGL